MNDNLLTLTDTIKNTILEKTQTLDEAVMVKNELERQIDTEEFIVDVFEFIDSVEASSVQLNVGYGMMVDSDETVSLMAVYQLGKEGRKIYVSADEIEGDLKPGDEEKLNELIGEDAFGQFSARWEGRADFLKPIDGFELESDPAKRDHNTKHIRNIILGSNVARVREEVSRDKVVGLSVDEKAMPKRKPKRKV